MCVHFQTLFLVKVLWKVENSKTWVGAQFSCCYGMKDTDWPWASGMSISGCFWLSLAVHCFCKTNCVCVGGHCETRMVPCWPKWWKMCIFDLCKIFVPDCPSFDTFLLSYQSSFPALILDSSLLLDHPSSWFQWKNILKWMWLVRRQESVWRREEKRN